MTVYLDAVQLQAMNKQLLVGTGERSFVRNSAGLDSIENLPKQRFFGTEAYPSLPAKLGITYIKLINLHCFEDANKRTAALALAMLADLNGWELTYSNEELADLTIKVAALNDAQLDYDALYLAIENHLQPR